MKRILLLVTIVLLLSSCESMMQTQGKWDKTNKSTEPVVLVYEGDYDALYKGVVQTMTSTGFKQHTMDKETGIIITEPKELRDDEKLSYNTCATCCCLAGTDVKEQKGTVFIMIKDTEKNNVYHIEMTCHEFTKKEQTYAYTYKDDVELYKNKIQNEKVLSQGHPLTMKIKSRILRIPGVKGEI